MPCECIRYEFRRIQRAVFPIARDLIPELIQIDELLKRIEIETKVLN